MALFIEFSASIVFLIFSISVLSFSIRIGNESTHSFLVGPAIFPGFISLLLTNLSACWLIDLLRKHGLNKILEGINGFRLVISDNKEMFSKLLVIIVASFSFVFVFIPLVGFVYATILFIVFSTYYFGKMKILYSILLAVVFSYAINYFFSNIMHVPLP